MQTLVHCCRYPNCRVLGLIDYQNGVSYRFSKLLLIYIFIDFDRLLGLHFALKLYCTVQ